MDKSFALSALYRIRKAMQSDRHVMIFCDEIEQGLKTVEDRSETVVLETQSKLINGDTHEGSKRWPRRRIRK